LPAFGAEPEPEPAPAPAPGKVEIQVQGGGQIRIQVAPQAAPEAGPAAARDAKPGYLGVQLDQTPAGQLQDGDPPAKERGKNHEGVGIVSVMEDGPAAKAGMKDGDRVLTFEGKEAKDFNQLREMVRAAKAGTAVKLTIRRGGKE